MSHNFASPVNLWKGLGTLFDGQNSVFLEEECECWLVSLTHWGIVLVSRQEEEELHRQCKRSDLTSF